MSSLEGLTEDDIKQLAEIQVATMTNTKTRLAQQRLTREVLPNNSYPELEAHERQAEQDKKLREEIATRDKRIDEMEMRGKRESVIQQLIDSGAIESRAQFSEIEKFGVENKIADYEKAAHFFKLSQTAAEPSSTTTFETPLPLAPVLEGLDKFRGSKSQWAEAEAYKALNEIKSGKIKLPSMH